MKPDAYVCHTCKSRHTTENMVATCAVCVHSLESRLDAANARIIELQNMDTKDANALYLANDTIGKMRKVLERCLCAVVLPDGPLPGVDPALIDEIGNALILSGGPEQQEDDICKLI